MYTNKADYERFNFTFCYTFFYQTVILLVLYVENIRE